MTQKTISLPEELYDRLKNKKKKNETFPELIRRLLSEEEKIKKTRNIDDLAGAFGDTSEEWDDIENEIYKDRLRFNTRKIYSIGED
jgi:predicted CopG family antitoxin